PASSRGEGSHGTPSTRTGSALRHRHPSQYNRVPLFPDGGVGGEEYSTGREAVKGATPRRPTRPIQLARPSSTGRRFPIPFQPLRPLHFLQPLQSRVTMGIAQLVSLV